MLYHVVNRLRDPQGYSVVEQQQLRGCQKDELWHLSWDAVQHF